MSVSLPDEGLEAVRRRLKTRLLGYLAYAIIDTFDMVLRNKGDPCGFTRFLLDCERSR